MTLDGLESRTTLVRCWHSLGGCDNANPRTSTEASYEALEATLQRARDAGKSEDEATEILSDAFTSAVRESGTRVAATLVRSAPWTLRRYRRYRRGFERRLRRHWGDALDLYSIVLMCAEEAGRQFDRRHRPNPTQHDPVFFEALSGLNARACRTALEAHHLLSGGFPMGALARCRTLHEIAVTALVLAEYSERSEHRDLAERYLSHHAVLTWADAQIYQQHCAALGYEPFSDDLMAGFRDAKEAVVRRYGSNYGADYGWAAGIDGLDRPRFRDLERLAEVSHLRGHYRWASHEVHADAKGWALNVMERGGVRYTLTSATNVGLAEPGHLALVSLHQTLVSLMFSPDPVSPQDMLLCQALLGLVDRAGDAFDQGERSVEEAEERFQARAASRRDPRRWCRR
jgi:hypothetical protein